MAHYSAKCGGGFFYMANTGTSAFSALLVVRPSSIGRGKRFVKPRKIEKGRDMLRSGRDPRPFGGDGGFVHSLFKSLLSQFESPRFYINRFF